MEVFIHLGRGFDAAEHSKIYERGETNDLTPFGFHLAQSDEVSISFSNDKYSPIFARLAHAFNRRLGFDIKHAWHNRSLIAKSDIIWTMSENEAFAIAALMMLKIVPRRPIIGNAIWLFNEWSRTSSVNRYIYRKLAKFLNVLTVHSKACLPISKKALPNTRVELLLFGINANEYRMTPPQTIASNRPIRILAAGNDRTRDWRTLLKAFGNDERFIVSAWTPSLDEKEVASYTNIRLPKPKMMRDIINMFKDTDVIVVPMVENVFSGITVALEAVALGKPLISSDTGGVPTYFSKEEVLFVPPNDPLALRNEALKARGDDLIPIAVAAQNRFKEEGYTTVDMIGRYMRLTREILKS